jgi:CRISPR-associated protein Csx3
MIVTRLIGLRVEFGNVILDPVMPRSMDGLSASLEFMGHSVTFRYAVIENCYSPKSIAVNGKVLEFAYENNKYRTGGAVIPLHVFLARLNQTDNVIDIHL